MDRDRFAQDLIAEGPAQLTGRPEVDPSISEERPELLLDRGEAEETRLAALLELDEDVDVAVGTEPLGQDRAEERETADPAA